MLLKGFYTIIRVASVPSEGHTQIDAEVTINPAHEIFQGHFPGQPVMPGVCMLQIIKEIAEGQTAKKLFVSAAANLKFLSVLNPEHNSVLKVDIKLKPSGPESIEMEAKLYNEGSIYFKIKAVCEHS